MQRRILGSAEQLAQRWRMLGHAEQREVMLTCGTQIAVQRQELAIRMAPRRLLALLTGSSTSKVDSHGNGEGARSITITEPVALRRAGREMALLVGSRVAADRSDPSLTRLVAKAWSLREALVKSRAPSLTAFAAVHTTTFRSGSARASLTGMTDRLARPRRATVHDVADAAGVSVATVSRSFALPEKVEEATRARVLAAARRLGFTPNPAARALRRQRTHLVGAVVPTLDHAIFARLINAFQARLAASGHVVVVLTAGFDAAEAAARLRLLVDRGAEALLTVGDVPDARLLRLLRDRRIPLVSTYSSLPGRPIPCIGFDNSAAVAKALEHAIALGHRRIAFLAGPLAGNDRQQARLAAFRAAMSAPGLAGPDRVVECRYGIEDGARGLGEVLDRFPDTTCILCSSDVLAFGVISACRALRIAVPERLSVIGFDDLDFAAHLDPPLTTLATPSERMGQMAAEAILRALADGGRVGSVELEVPLVLRGSTAPPSQSNQVSPSV